MIPPIALPPLPAAVATSRDAGGPGARAVVDQRPRLAAGRRLARGGRCHRRDRGRRGRCGRAQVTNGEVDVLHRLRSAQLLDPHVVVGLDDAPRLQGLFDRLDRIVASAVVRSLVRRRHGSNVVDISRQRAGVGAPARRALARIGPRPPRERSRANDPDFPDARVRLRGTPRPMSGSTNARREGHVEAGPARPRTWEAAPPACRGGSRCRCGRGRRPTSTDRRSAPAPVAGAARACDRPGRCRATRPAGRRVRRDAPLTRGADPPGHRPPRRVVARAPARPARARSRGGSCRGRRPRSGRRSAARSAPGSARRNGRSRPAAWRCRRTTSHSSRPCTSRRYSAIAKASRRSTAARYDEAPTADRRPRRPHASGSVSVLFSSRSCSRARTSSGVICVRCRWSRAITAPVAATPARPATPSHFHSFTR